MQIELSREGQEFLEQLVSEGRYASVDQAMLDALQLLQSREHLRAEIQKGIDDADAGRMLPAEEVFSSLRSRLQQIEQERQQSPKPSDG